MSTATANPASHLKADVSMSNSAAHSMEKVISTSVSPPLKSSPSQMPNAVVSANAKAVLAPLQPTPSTSATKTDSPLLANSDVKAVDAFKSRSTSTQQSEEIKREFDQDAELLASLASGTSNTKAGEDKSAMNVEDLEDPFTLPSLMHTLGGTEDEDSSGPIQAYAKLEFPGFSYYIQTLECTIGRRPAHMRSPPNIEESNQHITGATKQEGDVDVDLGFLKSISRLHVRIFYQDQSQLQSAYPSGMFDYLAESSDLGSTGRFVLQVLGRNGCFVDDVPVGKDAIVPLGKRTKIQIAERVFYFVLPPPPSNQRYNSDGELDSGESLGNSGDEEGDDGDEMRKDSDDSGSLGSSNSAGDESEDSSENVSEEKSDEKSTVGNSKINSKTRPKLVLKKKTTVEEKGGKGKGKGKHQGKSVWPGQGKTAAEKRLKEVDEGNSDGGMKSKSKRIKLLKEDQEVTSSRPRKRKRGDIIDAEQNKATLKAGTPAGVEATADKKKRKKKGEGEEVDVDMQEKEPINMVKGKGKSGGKALVVAAAVAAKAKADEEKLKAKGTNNAVKDSSSAITTASSSALVRPTAQSAVATSSAGITTQHMISPRPNSFVRPPITANASVRPLAASTPNIAYKGTLPSTRPAIAPRPLANGVAPLSNNSPSPVTNTVGKIGASLMPPSNAISSTSNLTAPLRTTESVIKPELSNMDLIRNALANPLSISRGGKLTLTEIYEDISSRYEWYRLNNRANGKDWHGLIRQAVGNSKEMIRIPRKAHEHGKGVFYAFNSSPAAHSHIREMGSGGNSVQLIEAASVSASPTPSTNTAKTNNAMPSTPSRTSVSTDGQTNLIPLGTSSHPVIAPAATVASSASGTKPRPFQASTRPSPPIQANGRVSIVIGKAPAEALAQMAATPKAAITQNIEALFGGPPIVHHEGKLYLSPLVFGHMSAKEINEIGGKGAQQALAILQGHLVSHLQGKMRKSDSPAPNTPAKKQEQRITTTATQPAAATAAASPLHKQSRPSSTTSSVKNSSSSAPPAQGSTSRTPQVTAAVMNSVRPQMTSQSASASSVLRPLMGNNPVRPAPVNAIPTNRPGPVAAPARPLARPATPTNTVRPGPNQISSRPSLPSAGGQRAPPRPLTDINARPLVPTSLSTIGKPGVNVPRPIGVAPTATNARPNAAATLSSHTRPPLPALQNVAALPRPTSIVNTSATTVNKVEPAKISKNNTNTAPVKTSFNAASVTPSSSAMLSAMQALASHPDAAGLMTLLNGGKVTEGSKLTSGQLDLLQQAGKMAAEQQSAQQQNNQKQLTSSVSTSTSTKDNTKTATSLSDDTKGKAKDST